MTEEPASLILEPLRQMRVEIGDVRSDIATKADLASLRADVAFDMHTLRAHVAADLLTTRKELSQQIVELRRAVVDYHTSVIGRGVIISELEARAAGRTAPQPRSKPLRSSSRP
jgi:hypothetical protein